MFFKTAILRKLFDIGGGGGVLKEFLSGDVPLEPWKL